MECPTKHLIWHADKTKSFLFFKEVLNRGPKILFSCNLYGTSVCELEPSIRNKDVEAYIMVVVAT